MAEELKPCPFCGCTAIKPHDNGYEDWFQCDWCGATSGWNGDTPEDEAKSAADWWNTRAPAGDKWCAAVKPLEWVADEFDPDCITASHYDISHEAHGYRLYFWQIVQGDAYARLSAAKAAAQADYERRILSAVTLRPASEVRREALEEAIEQAEATDSLELATYGEVKIVQRIRALIEEDKA